MQVYLSLSEVFNLIYNTFVCLCRKNAYNRLMLLFPVLCNDHRTGHAVLDIFESALRVKEAARYLIERCELIPFIISMLSPQSLIDSFIGIYVCCFVLF